MARVMTPPRPPIAAAHLRNDAWWALPVTVVIVLGSFIVYSTWAALQNAHYFAPPYLSPFYSPCLSSRCLHMTFGYGLPDVQLPIIGVLSPAFLILWGPGLFRLTCYYYRKAYYRSFWLAPPACAVRDVKRRYTGETRVPLLLQNFHRYTWYVAVIFIVLLTWDAILALRFPAPGGGTQLGIGVGTLVMWANVILLAGYTFSCHSCRHVCGGHVDVFSRARTRYRAWHVLSRLNERHPVFAWLSLFSVGVTDLYIRLVSMGVIRDLRIL
ncbi:MAG: hypothetical protein E6K82_09580 [Candidatus Rokuibacteriota bacterium]|nr:MAG: hypothetical protein E6K82_09580 [Candidatus Rokubacteria bacterium]